MKLDINPSSLGDTLAALWPDVRTSEGRYWVD